MARPKRKTEVPDLASFLDTIQEGDCLQGMKKLPDACADMIAIDPPFNIGRDYAAHDDNMELEEYLVWCAHWLDECVRILKPTGSLWLCSSEEHVCELKVIAEGRLDLADILRTGKRLKHRHHIIWFYTFGINSPRKLSRSHTHILHFVKSLKHHKWCENAVRVPSARQAIYNDKRANPDGRLPDDTWIIRPTPAAGLVPDHDVWHFNRVCGTYKERRDTDNQMPEQLLGRIIRLCTEPGDLVVDPFGGSFTTAAVAKKLGRRFISYELDQAYYLQGLHRLSACKAGDMLDGKGPL